MLTRFSSRTAAAGISALIAAALLAGCHDDTPPPSSTVVNTPPASTTTVAPGGAATTAPMTTPDTKINVNAGPGGSTGTDAALADQVNTAIVHNKQMTGSRVEAVASGGTVTLTGQVQNQQQKALAEKTASQVPGVSSDIKNKLIIVSTGGAKPKPKVVTKTKTIVIHGQAAPTDTSSGTAGTGSTDAGSAGTTPSSGADTTTPSQPSTGQTPPPATSGNP